MHIFEEAEDRERHLKFLVDVDLVNSFFGLSSGSR